MLRSEQIALARRALDLVEANTTSLNPTEYRVPATDYTDVALFERERRMILESPQLVGYASELAGTGTYCTKTVMGRNILVTRVADGQVKAFDNVCLHRQASVAVGCGKARRFACPYHSWTYDNSGRLLTIPGREGFPETTPDGRGLTELPATEYAGFLWVSLNPAVELDMASYLGELGPELASWNIGEASPLGEKVLDVPISWKLAVDTASENYHFATVHKTTFATVARSNCTVFDAFGQHHRLIFPLNAISSLKDVPEDQWEPLNAMVVIYHLHPNVLLSVTMANGELFRIYPGDAPGHSITVHQNSTGLDVTDEAIAAGSQLVFDYAHATVRDEDYLLAADVQRNLESGVRPEVVFGRNEPGLQHRHSTWRAAVEARESVTPARQLIAH